MLPQPAAGPVKSEAFQRLKAGFDARAAGLAPGGTERVLASGFAALDGVLAGGIPRGTIATLEGAASAGRTAIAAGFLARAASEGLVAAIDDGTLYPPDLARAGVPLDRLLVVAAGSPLGVARGTDIVLRSRAFGMVLLPAVPLRAAVWSRLAALAQKADAVVLGVGTACGELGYFASVRVGCAIERVLWRNPSGPFCELAGYDVCARVLKHRRTAPGTAARVRVCTRAGVEVR